MIAELMFLVLLLALTVPFLCDLLLVQYFLCRLLGGRGLACFAGMGSLIRSPTSRITAMYNQT